MPGKNECVRVMIPRMMPLPVRSEVIVTELVPVCMSPRVMFNVATVASASNLTTEAVELLFTVSVLKVLGPLRKVS